VQKTEERTFTGEDGSSVLVKTTQLPALRSFRLLARLGKLMGPALGSLKGIKLKSDVASLVPALMRLSETLDPDEIESLASQVLEGTLVVSHGRAVPLQSVDQINGVCAGDLMLLFKLMAFAVEVNFRDFFRGFSQAVVPNGPPDAPDAPASVQPASHSS